MNAQTLTTGMMLAFTTGWLIGLAVGGSSRSRRNSYENRQPPQGLPPLKLARTPKPRIIPRGYQPSPQQSTPNPPPRRP